MVELLVKSARKLVPTFKGQIVAFKGQIVPSVAATLIAAGLMSLYNSTIATTHRLSSPRLSTITGGATEPVAAEDKVTLPPPEEILAANPDILQSPMRPDVLALTLTPEIVPPLEKGLIAATEKMQGTPTRTAHVQPAQPLPAAAPPKTASRAPQAHRVARAQPPGEPPAANPAPYALASRPATTPTVRFDAVSLPSPPARTAVAPTAIAPLPAPATVAPAAVAQPPVYQPETVAAAPPATPPATADATPPAERGRLGTLFSAIVPESTIERSKSLVRDVEDAFTAIVPGLKK